MGSGTVNSAPTINSFTITDVDDNPVSEIFVGQTVSMQVTVEDVDQDDYISKVYFYEVTGDGDILLEIDNDGSNGWSLDSWRTDEHETGETTLRVVAADSFDERSAPADMTVTFILPDSPPEITDFSIDELSPDIGDTLTISGTVTDVDGDTISEVRLFIDANKDGFADYPNEWIGSSTSFDEYGNWSYTWDTGSFEEIGSFNIIAYAVDENIVMGRTVSRQITFNPQDIVPPEQPDSLVAVVNGPDAALDWGDSFDNNAVKEYQLEYAMNSEFTDAASSSVAVSEFDLNSLVDGVYYWRVKAVDNNDNVSEWSEVNSFSIDTAAPSDPASLSADVAENDVTLDWTDSIDNLTGVSEYSVEYSLSADFSDSFIDSAADSNLDLNDLADGVYYWRVKAVDNNGNETGWTDGSDFMIDTTAPAAPANLVEIPQGSNAVLDWDNASDNVSGVKEYVVEYADNAEFNSANTQTVSDSVLNISNLSYGTWYWRAAAVDNFGNQSDWSTVSTFDTGDTAGNTFADAENIDVDEVFCNSEHVGAGDACDIYCFDVETAGQFNIVLTGLESKAFVTIYSIVNGKYKSLKKASAKTDKATGETGAFIDNFLLNSGTYWIEVMSGDKGKGKCNTDYELEITPAYFPEEDVSDEFNFKTGTGSSGDLDIESGASGWVGFCDPQDVYTFDVASAGEFNFKLTGLESKVSIALYTLVKGKYKAIKKAAAKEDKSTGEIAAVIDNALLDVGTYYLEILSGDKGKGKCNTTYDLDVVTDIFPDATDNNTWELASEITLDFSTDNGFVGFGDACDWYKFQVDDLTTFDFDLTGEDKNARLTVYIWDDNKDKLKKVKNAKLKFGEANIDNLNLDAGLYYVEVLSADKGKGKKNTEYGLEITAM